MSLIKIIKAQLGLSGTPGNNFTLDASADNGTMKLARGNAGATTQDIMTVDAAGKVSFPQSPSVNNGPAFSAKLTSNQTGVVSGSWTKVLFDSELFDTNNCFASSRFTPNVAGYYQISCGVSLNSANAAITTVGVGIRKNNILLNAISFGVPNVIDATPAVSALIYMNGTTDYVECFAIIVGGTGLNFRNFDSTSFTGVLVRAAQ